MTQSRFSIKLSERVLIAGKTGSGKSVLAGGLLWNAERLIVIDPKNNLRERWKLEDFSKEAVARKRFRLHVGDQTRDDFIKSVDRAFFYAMQVQNCIVYIDEAYGVFAADVARSETVQAHRAYTQGREFKVSVWLATQRPSSIPLVTVSEAEHVFAFRLNVEEDRKRLAKAFHPELEQVPKARDRTSHPFWYYYVKDDKPTLIQHYTPPKGYPLEG